MNESVMTMPQMQKPVAKPSVLKNIFTFFPGKTNAVSFWQSKSIMLLLAAIFYGLARLWLSYPLTIPSNSSRWLPWAVSGVLFLVLHAHLGLATIRYVYKSKCWPLVFLQTIVLASVFFLILCLFAPVILSPTTFADVANFSLLSLVWLIAKHEQILNQAERAVLSLPKDNAPQARQWIAENKTNRVDAKTLRPGDKIIVLSGETIPRDGIIVAGDTSVDESELTRTTTPLHKTKGDVVFGGTLNRDSEIQIEIQGPYSEDLLPVLAGQTQNLIHEKTKSRQVLSGLVRILPVLFLFLAVVAGWLVSRFVFADIRFENTFATIVATLAAMPLGLSFLQKVRQKTIGQFWQQGIVIKKAATLERLGALKTVFFNKTGILTNGEFLYSQEIMQSGNSLGEFLGVVFSLEAGVDHPLAKAVTQHPWYNEIPQAKILNKTFYPGLGISGTLQAPDQSRFQACVGNLRFMKRHQCQISRELKTKIEDLENLGETVIMCGYDREVRGIMSFGDTLRRHVTRALTSIQQAGVATALITGDTEKTITQILGDAPFSQVYARCTPDEKIAQMLKAETPAQQVALVTSDLQNETGTDNKITIALDTGLHIRQHPADVLILNAKIENVATLIIAAKSLQKIGQWGLWGSLALSGGLVALVFACQIHPLISLGASTLWAGFLAYKSSSKMVEL